MECDFVASWRLPDVRRDRDRHLAQLFRDICDLDSCEGCFASNAWFERQLGVVESTIKRVLAVLVECGLVEVEVLHGNERRIRPLVSLADVLTAGGKEWKELCEAVLDRHKFPSVLRRLAASVLRRLGVRRGQVLSRLGYSEESAAAGTRAGQSPWSFRCWVSGATVSFAYVAWRAVGLESLARRARPRSSGRSSCGFGFTPEHTLS